MTPLLTNVIKAFSKQFLIANKIAFLIVSIFSSFALPFDETGLIVTAATLFPLCVVGIFGNVVTIMTILISTKLTYVWDSNTGVVEGKQCASNPL